MVIARLTPGGVVTQISWDEDFDHETGRELFGSNLLALTWIKGDPLPGELVGDILRGLGLERETDEQQRRRVTLRRAQSPTIRRPIHKNSSERTPGTPGVLPE